MIRCRVCSPFRIVILIFIAGENHMPKTIPTVLFLAFSLLRKTS